MWAGSNKMKIPGILELNSRTRYGMTSRNVPIYLFRPLDFRKHGLCLVGCSQRDTTSNVLALIDVDQWMPDSLTRGQLIRIIGKCGHSPSEKEALLYQYTDFPWKKFDISSIQSPIEDIPLLKGYTFNVDPIGCRDIDDVFTIGDDGYFYITIADVAGWFKKNQGHPFISIASNIGQTLYSYGQVVAPMLPFEKECSLLPGEERCGVSMRFKWIDNAIQDISFLKTKLINTETFNYESIYHSKYSQILHEISSHLLGRDTIDSHEWIEQLMILYNTEAAKVLVEKGEGLLRTHSEPELEKLNAYKMLIGLDARYIGYKSATYVDTTAENTTHWGLQKQAYCHATSPIRRFADIVNQHVLKNDEIGFSYDIDILNNQSKYAKQYERELFFLDTILNSKSKYAEGAVVLNDHRIWVSEWKRTITCKNTFLPGTRGIVRYSLDMNQTTWKRKMVFRFEDTTIVYPSLTQ